VTHSRQGVTDFPDLSGLDFPMNGDQSRFKSFCGLLDCVSFP